MADNPFTTGIARWAHVASLPWRLFGVPSGAALREGVRQRNILLDALFYDVHVIGHDEAVELAPRKAGEGAILIVPPSGGAALTICGDIEAFLAAGGGAIRTLTVAGVGSSALGTAAFARNVADAVGHPVAAIVSGYGLADLVTGGAAGVSWYAGLDGIYHLWEQLDHSLDWIRAAETGTPATPPPHAHHDSETVLALLRDDRIAIDLIVAHSKGNLVVADALHALQRSDRARSDAVGAAVHIVEVSARVKMPRSCRRVTEVVGRWDLIGDFAMRREAPAAVVVPEAWHHTNTELYGHVPVTKVLKELLGEPSAPSEP